MKQISANPTNYKGYDKLGRPHWIQTEIAPKAESKRPTIKHLNYSDWVKSMGKHPQFRQYMDEYLKGHGLTQKDVDSAVEEHAKAQNIDMFTGSTGKVSDRSRFILDKVAEYHRKEAGNHAGPIKTYLDGIRDFHGADPYKGYSEVAKSISTIINRLITGQTKINPQGHTLTLAPTDNGQIRRWQLFNDSIRMEQISIGYAGMQEISDQLRNSPFPELAFMGFFKLDNLKSIRFDITNNQDGNHQSIVMEKAGMETMDDARNLVRFFFTHYHPEQHSIKVGVPVQHLQPFTKREVRSWNALYTAGVQFEIWDELYTTDQIRQLRSLPVSAYDLRTEETAMTVRYFGEPYLVTLAPDETSVILFPTDSTRRIYRSTDIIGQPVIRKADTMDYNRHYSFFHSGHLYVMNSYVANEMLDVEKIHADMDTQHDILEDLQAKPAFTTPETEQTINDLAQHGITLELHDEVSPFLAQVLPSLPGLIHNSFSPEVYEYVKGKGLILIVNRATYALSREEIKATYTSDTWEDEDGTMKDVHLIQIYYGDPFNIIHEFTHFLDFSGYFKETGTESELKWICNELKSYPSMKQTTELLRRHYPADMRTALYLNKDSEVLARFIEQVTAANDPDNPFAEDIEAYTNLTNSGYWSPEEMTQITQTEQFRKLTSKLPWKIFGVVAKSLFYGLIGILKSIIPTQRIMEGQTKPSGDHTLVFHGHRWHNDNKKQSGIEEPLNQDGLSNADIVRLEMLSVNPKDINIPLFQAIKKLESDGNLIRTSEERDIRGTVAVKCFAPVFMSAWDHSESDGDPFEPEYSDTLNESLKKALKNIGSYDNRHSQHWTYSALFMKEVWVSKQDEEDILSKSNPKPLGHFYGEKEVKARFGRFMDDAFVFSKQYGSAEETAIKLLQKVESNLHMDLSGKYKSENGDEFTVEPSNKRGDKYNDLMIYDASGEYIDHIKLRIADHSYNPANNYHDPRFLSVNIANKNETIGKFGGAYNLNFSGDSDYNDIVDAARNEIQRHIDDIGSSK